MVSGHIGHVAPQTTRIERVADGGGRAMKPPVPRLSKRALRLRQSGTAQVFEAVAELRRQGDAVLALSLGEPDYLPPPEVLVATKRALDRGATRYTQVSGMQSLREAICDDSAARRTVRHQPDQVVVGAGAKHVLFNLAQALYDPGDRVIIPTPCWGSYIDQALYCGALPIPLETRPEDGFLPTPAALEQALESGAKAVVLCVPSNPTGAVADRDAWLGIAGVLRKHEVFVIVDEIYAQLTYDGFCQTSLLEVAPDLADRVVIVDGVSKTYAMTGFRIGWMLGPAGLATTITALQSQMTTNVSTPAQWAAEAALRGDQTWVAEMRSRLQEKRDVLCHGVRSVGDLSLPVAPRGAFYAFVDVRGWCGPGHRGVTLADDMAVTRFLLDKVRLSVVPGMSFSAPGYIRLSFAASRADLEDAVERLRSARSLLD